MDESSPSFYTRMKPELTANRRMPPRRAYTCGIGADECSAVNILIVTGSPGDGCDHCTDGNDDETTVKEDVYELNREIEGLL